MFGLLDDSHDLKSHEMNLKSKIFDKVVFLVGDSHKHNLLACESSTPKVCEHKSIVKEDTTKEWLKKTTQFDQTGLAVIRLPIISIAKSHNIIFYCIITI